MIETKRLFLRKIIQTDIHKVHEGLSHPDVIRYYGVSFMTLAATQEQMDWYANLEKEGTGQWFAIIDKDTDVFVGAGGYNDVDKVHRKAEIGFWLLPEHWGKGIMKEGMNAIFRYGFDNLNLHRIEGFVDSENKNCKKAVAKVGFNHEGTMVDCEVKKGRYVSIDIYAKFDDQ